MSESNEPTLDELFSRDPLTLTKDDRKVIITYYRERRGTFLATGASAKPKTAKPKADKSAGISLDLGDLDL